MIYIVSRREFSGPGSLRSFELLAAFTDIKGAKSHLDGLERTLRENLDLEVERPAGALLKYASKRARQSPGLYMIEPGIPLDPQS